MLTNLTEIVIQVCSILAAITPIIVTLLIVCRLVTNSIPEHETVGPADVNVSSGSFSGLGFFVA